jgi:dihydropteroate synthase
MASAGADILDIGGESSRPGAEPVPVDEELRRVLPAIRGARGLGLPISIDTTKGAVARAALEAGASIVNDISGLRFDPELGGVVGEAGAGLVIMHSRGTPRDMQRDPRYHDVVADVAGELEEAARRAEAAGVAGSRIVIDPGIGFAKTFEQSLEVMRHLDVFVAQGRPVMVGVSRKSFIGRLLDEGIDGRLEGSVAAAVAAVLAGVHLVRVHDVGATVRAVRVADALRNGSPTP